MPKRSLPLMLLCVASVLGAEPACDRFGDPLPEGATARLGCLSLRSQRPVLTGAFSPDGKYLVTGGGMEGGTGEILFWDSATGKEAPRLRINLPFRVHGLRFLADGKSLIVVGSSGGFRILDAATGIEQRKFNPPGDFPVLALDVSRDGKTAVTTGFRGDVIVWDLVHGKRLLERTIPVNRSSGNNHSPFPPLTVLTPDGKQLVLPQEDCSLHLVNVALGEKVVAFEMPESQPKGMSHLELPTVAVSPDGRYLAYASSWLPAVLCDLKTGKILHLLTERSTNNMRLSFTPDSRSVIVHSGSAIHLFDTASGKEIRKIEKSSWMGHPLALSPDGKTLAYLESRHVLSLWDLSTGRQLHSSIRHTEFIRSIVFFPDGKRLASSDFFGNLIVWDIASAQELAHLERSTDKPRSLAANVDGKTLQFLNFRDTIYRWNPLAGGKASQQILPQTNFYEFVLSPDGRTIAGALRTAPAMQVLLRDLQGDKSARTITMPKNVRIRSLSFSPDNRLLLIGASDNVLRLWDRDTGKLVRELPPDDSSSRSIYAIFSSDGRSLAYHDYGAGFGTLGMGVRIREIASGGFRLQIPHRGGIPLAYSPDGRFLACSSPSWGVDVLDAATGKVLARQQGPQVSLFSLAFSPDSRLLATGYGDGTILLWKVPDSEGLPATLKEEEAGVLWQSLADEDTARANRALAGLAAAPALAVPLIKERFPTDWKEPDDKQIARWIAELDDDDFKVREKATHELSDAVFDAADALRQALAKTPSSEAKRRIEGILSRLNKGGSPKHLRALRAIEVLERIGSPQAKDVLRSLAGKALPPELREEVQATLRRLGDKS